MIIGNRLHRVAAHMSALFAAVLLSLLLASVPARAQDAPPDATTADAGSDATDTNTGPVRMAWFKLVTGAVTWRADSGLDWSAASINLPIRQGAQVYAPTGARAEIQFDDGSMMHLGGGALVTFHNLYSDADGEFTQITMKDGLASFRLRNKLSIYQVDTPLASVKAVGPARIRIGVHDTVEVGVRYGSATVEGQQDKATIPALGFLTIQDTTSPFVVTKLPPDDSWERWVAKRSIAANPAASTSKQDLPPDIYLVAPDLDTYGSWQTAPDYGAVWCPHVAADWRPYAAGSWVWVDPFGWTWVSAEPWGWAPYHYGSWVHGGFGWGWVPGPAYQYWSPGVVIFVVEGDSVAWAPLCPEEIRYPAAFDIGLHAGNWSLFFSIRGCGVYYPGEDHICEARRWDTGFVNRRRFLTDKDHNAAHFAFVENHNAFLQGGGWVPRNAALGGASLASLKEFASGRHYDAVRPDNLAVFQRGHPIGLPEAGNRPSAGPPNIRPALSSLTPARGFTHVTLPPRVAARTTFRATVPQRIALNAPVRPGRPTSGGAGGPRSTPTVRPQPGAVPMAVPARAPFVHPQPGSPEDMIVRARGSVGLPQRARADDGHVVGPGTVAPPVPVRRIMPNPPAYVPIPRSYTVREAPTPPAPRPAAGGGGGGGGGGGRRR